MGFWSREKTNIDYTKLPRHIGVIMDGNGRWAKKRGLPRSMGHRYGAQTLKKITLFCDELGIEVLTVYAFSTENWKRPKSEVDNLMSLLMEYLSNAEQELGSKNVVIKIIGDLSSFSDEIREQINKTEKLTEKNTGMVLNIALNYGGRDEIVNAVRAIVKAVFRPTASMKIPLINIFIPLEIPVDLIIRPSGECRLSNFCFGNALFRALVFKCSLA